MAKSLLPLELQHPGVLALIQLALEEDLVPDTYLGYQRRQPMDGDITSLATIPTDNRFRAFMRAKANGVVAGMPAGSRGVSVHRPHHHVQKLAQGWWDG